ncbi:MAG TPA: MBL fold metallo-hydrolase, partial [Dehalococcoidia bacterium]|nr:MBL fold metallo-hydrolase [Dehalococcoidia bacterium]
MTWLGHSCLRIRGREANIIMDPLGPEWGLTGRLEADIVTAS